MVQIHLVYFLLIIWPYFIEFKIVYKHGGRLWVHETPILEVIFVNRGGIADLLLLRTLLAICQISQQLSFWEGMNSFVLLAYASLAASRILLQWLLTFLNFRLRRFIPLVETKEMISMNYGSSTSCWKPWGWVRLNLIPTMRDVCISSNLNPLTKFASSRRSTEFKDILPWNISEMITKTIWISTRIFKSYAMKRASHFEFNGKSIETTWLEFPKWREGHCRTNTSISRNK